MLMVNWRICRCRLWWSELRKLSRDEKSTKITYVLAPARHSKVSCVSKWVLRNCTLHTAPKSDPFTCMLNDMLFVEHRILKAPFEIISLFLFMLMGKSHCSNKWKLLCSLNNGLKNTRIGRSLNFRIILIRSTPCVLPGWSIIDIGSWK